MIILNDLILWGLVHVGLLYFITESAIFAPVRKAATYGLKPSHLLVTLLYCTGCCGFWLGGVQVLLELEVFEGPPFWGRVLLQALAGMGLGAAWGGWRRDSVTEMFMLEQGHKFEVLEASDAEAGTAGTSSERDAGGFGSGGSREPAPDADQDRRRVERHADPS
jgi:hypothetical protein